jgi:AcrR family transcriptional regulator
MWTNYPVRAEGEILFFEKYYGKYCFINIFLFLCWKIFYEIYFPILPFMKDEILQRALKQFLKYGIRKMSIQKLVASLGISTKTVYKYFKNKEELLKAVLHLHYTQQYQLLENHSADQNVVPLIIDIWYMAVEREYSVNKTFFHDLHYYYPELERKTEAATGQKIWKQIQQIIQKGIKEGVFKKNIYPEVVLEGIAVLYNPVARTGQFKRFRVSPYEIFLNTIVLYIRGFCTRKGIKELDKHISTLKPFGGIKLAR